MLVRGGREAGLDVFVAAAPGALAAELDVPPYPVPLLGRSPWKVPGGALAVRRAISACRAEVVHSHNPGMALATGLATARGRSPHAVASCHGVPDEDYSAAARVFRLAGLPVVACGPGVAAGLSEHGLRAAATVLNAVGAAPPAYDRDALEQEWGIPSGHRLAVCVGRLATQKNHVLAVEALQELPDVTLAILGEGELRHVIEARARELGVTERLRLPGVRTDARAIVAAADVFVLPSRWEGLPLVALEALAAGTPVVATAVRGVRELLTDRRNGLLVPPDDAAALARAVAEVLGDTRLAGSLRDEGLRLATQHGEEEMVAEYIAIYRRLAAGQLAGCV
jgi:glycosyltransferase involved in cell wall biosynthesis